MTIKTSATRGRPELPDKDKRSVVTQFRCTPSEKRVIDRAARLAGLRVSDWLREKAMQGAAK